MASSPGQKSAAWGSQAFGQRCSMGLTSVVIVFTGILAVTLIAVLLWRKRTQAIARRPELEPATPETVRTYPPAPQAEVTPPAQAVPAIAEAPAITTGEIPPVHVADTMPEDGSEAVPTTNESSAPKPAAEHSIAPILDAPLIQDGETDVQTEVAEALAAEPEISPPSKAIEREDVAPPEMTAAAPASEPVADAPPTAAEVAEATDAEEFEGASQAANEEPIILKSGAADPSPVEETSTADAEPPGLDDAAEEVLEEPGEEAPAAIAAPANNDAPGAAEEAPRQKRKPAVYQDRRGGRRAAAQPQSEPRPAPSNQNTVRSAEALVRLTLKTFPKSALLSLVLAKPEGFPGTVSVNLDGEQTLNSYGPRYDDIDLPWTPELFDDELRVTSAEGREWLRSARRVQLFTARPDESELMSVNSARLGTEHWIICKAADFLEVERICQSAGSPALTQLTGYEGIPANWVIVSGYVPRQNAQVGDQAFSLLNPDSNISISLTGGLEIRAKMFAEGHAPRIEIDPVPGGTSVTIGGKPAQYQSGAWVAEDWDAPGDHLVDVVPGPSLTYTIVADPAKADGWAFYDAHAGRSASNELWAQIQICGAGLQGPNGESVFARETQVKIVALGSAGGVVPFHARTDADVSIATPPQHPAFLFVSSGLKRNQNKLQWLGTGRGTTARRTGRSERAWADAIHMAAATRPLMESNDAAAKDLWHKAVRKARSVRRRPG